MVYLRQVQFRLTQQRAPWRILVLDFSYVPYYSELGHLQPAAGGLGCSPPPPLLELSSPPSPPHQGPPATPPQLPTPA